MEHVILFGVVLSITWLIVRVLVLQDSVDRLKRRLNDTVAPKDPPTTMGCDFGLGRLMMRRTR